MIYRPLGTTGIMVSEIGYGTWGLGGDAYGPIATSDVMTLIGSALAHGITTFDTAPLYGEGRAECLVGDGVCGQRNQMVIISKAGQPSSGVYDFSPDALRASVTETLKRLRTDYLDVLLLHSPDLEVLSDTSIRALYDLVSDQTIRTWGIAARTPEDGMRALHRWDVPVVEVNLSLADQRALDCGLLEEASVWGVGVIARTPLCYGYLADAPPSLSHLSPSDHRRTVPASSRDQWSRAATVYTELADARGCTISQLALRWCLDQPAVATVIPGMLTLDEIAEDMQVASLSPLSNAEQQRIRNLYQQYHFAALPGGVHVRSGCSV